MNTTLNEKLERLQLFPNLRFTSEDLQKMPTMRIVKARPAIASAWPFPKLEPTEANLTANPFNELFGTVDVVHIYNPDYPKGGLTVAYRKSTPFKSGVMVEVAVHTCSEADSFSKKVGNAGATEKFMNGQTIHLPILKLFQKEDIATAVKRAFTALYDAT